jgi:hypothetical protein
MPILENSTKLPKLPIFSDLIHSESESELLYDWRFIACQFVSAASFLRLTTSSFIFQLNTCGYSPYGITSLTRGWICRLKLLLVLDRSFILKSESRWTYDHNLLSQIWDFPNLEDQFPVYLPGTWWLGYTPRQWVPFSAPPTSRRAAVEVFDPASTRDDSTQI